MSETYTVKAGDTLSKIALAKLGDLNRWTELAELNKISNPNLIRVGQVLQLPKMSATPIVVVPPAPTDEEIPDIVDPGTGQASMTVTATKFPWFAIAAVIATAYFLMRKR